MKQLNRTYLVFGGAGLVGMQICRRIATELKPAQVIVASLLEAEANAGRKILAEEFPQVSFAAAWGNIFVPSQVACVTRAEMVTNAAHRECLLEFLYGDFEEAYRASHLQQLISEWRPDVIIDAINTATAISYQNVFDGIAKVRERTAGGDLLELEGRQDLETLLMSQSMPQLIRHLRLYERACAEAGVAMYLKVGTTGTGGMGLNIPYTHSEDKPSPTLLSKTALAFGQTGLLFLWARTPGAPIVKEIKPAAMIGYKAVRYGPVFEQGKPMGIYGPQLTTLAPGGKLPKIEPLDGYRREGDLVTVTVDTGENGIFTHGEFAAITSMGQMEFVTPEEIAHLVIMELVGANTGRDVIGAIDGSIMGPTYRAGLLRSLALRDLQAQEQKTGMPSVALGRLGPPQLSKLLFEAAFLKEGIGESIAHWFEHAAPLRLQAAEVCRQLDQLAQDSLLGRQAVSVGVPILLSDGVTLLRGPRINVPELSGLAQTVTIKGETQIDEWAERGWVDLRPANIARWFERLEKMVQSRRQVVHEGSAAVDLNAYMGNVIAEGDAVAWIFNNELKGHRIK